MLAVTPGMVHTSLWRHFPLWCVPTTPRPSYSSPLALILTIPGPCRYQILTYPIRAVALRSAEDAAQGVVYAAAAVEADGRSGAYLADGIEVEPSPAARDVQLAARLYAVCDQLISEELSQPSIGVR